MYAYTQRDSAMQNNFQKAFRQTMEQKLATRPHIAEKCTSIVLSFGSCQRITIRVDAHYCLY